MLGRAGGRDLYTIKIRMPDAINTESANKPVSPRTEPDPAGRLRPAFGVWLRDLVVSLAISAMWARLSSRIFPETVIMAWR